MRKIILLLFLVSFSGYSQLDEGFEGGIPATWTVFDNGVGTVQSWGITTNIANVHSGSQSAEVVRGNIGEANVSEDWLVTPLTSVITNAQLRFFARSNFAGNNGTLYQIRISSASTTDPKDVSSYSIIKEYTELQLSAQANVYEEKVESLAAYAGTSRYIAFVRVHKQLASQTTGDSWLLDDVRMVAQCFDPYELTVTNITAQTALLGWKQINNASLYDVEYGPSGFVPGTGTLETGVSNPHTATGLPDNASCQFYVRSRCTSDAVSAWVGPFSFTTNSFGLNCTEPISFTTLPFEVKGGDTANYADIFDLSQGTSCGAVPSVTNYLDGNDVFYSYLPVASGTVNITMTPIGATSTNSSLFVYEGCANVGISCLVGRANSALAARSVSFNAVAGQTYIIVISSSAVTQTVKYDLMVQAENCGPKPSALNATNIKSNSADLTWTSAGFSSWQVALQPLGAAIPTGDGDYTTQNPYPVGNLTPGTQYQYWVRSECVVGSGTYTSWAGPYFFTTLVCDLVDTCNYTFRMTDSANNGWNGATMYVRQNGIVVATIGSTYTSGAGPVDVIVPLCKNVPYDLFWQTAGTQPQQCKVSVINSFGQTLYTKAAGEGAVGTILYSDTTNCTAPSCTIAPINPTAASILTTAATLTWTAPATTLWDVYLVLAGSPAPDASSTPTYNDVNSNPFLVTGLSVDTSYDFYVRVVCSPMPSEWSTKGTFTTVATCYRPKNLDVTGISSTSANLNWTNANPSDTKWDILLVPSTTMTPPTQLPPTNPSIPGMILISGNTTPSPLTVSTLTPATIYYYYIRTVCSTVDSSVWEGPFVFNTPICDESKKCNYQFSMIDIGGNGWDGGVMEVRQNGIVVKSIGPGFTTTGPINVSVPLCEGVPFDVYWKTAGAMPQEIGLQILNPFEDVIYTKLPGQGNPSEVLFISTGNCMPPSCPKPTNLLAPQVTLTATSAELSWTETGGATKWEVYVVPTVLFTPIPVNGSPISGVAPYYIADTNPFIVDGLSPSTNYTFYVRAICSPTDISTWTTIHSQKFTTKPLNDECFEATVLDVNPTKVPTLGATGNTLGATLSLPATFPVCEGDTDDDVWYSFVATSKTHIITISDIVGLTKNMNHVLYSGSDCSTLTQLYCSDSDLSVANNLTPGNTYKIRVYTALPGINQRASFTISVTTPPAITNDECSNAIQAPVNDDLPCTVTASGMLAGASGSADATTCGGTADDDVWFSFVSNSSIQNISLVNIVGTTTSLNFEVYSGTCGSLTSMYCTKGDTLSDLIEGFTEGQTYFVRVWSNTDVPQDVTFDLCIGKIIPPITTSTTLYNTTQLVEDILLNTKCASVSNVTSSTGVNFGEVNGIGYFNKSLSGFPFKDGVILSCASALTAPGPSVKPVSAETTSWPGDSDLSKIVYEATGGTGNTYNTTKLEFDFVPVSDKISFNFIFASEEYGQFQCVYADVFAFLLTNTETGVTTNLAIVPNTNDPISVLTIRDELYNTACGSENEEYFDKYYGENGLNPLGAPVNFKGITIPMTASAVTVPGVKYHIKMAIADYLDSQLDSAIFLEGGSFNIGSVELGESFTGANALCQGGSTTLVSDLDPADYTFQWTKDDVTIPNETAPTLVVTAPGVYAIKAQYGASTCYATDSVTIEYYQETAPGAPNDLIVCDATITSGVFDLTKNSAIILAPYATPHTVDYFLNQADADNNVNSILTPESFTNTTNLQTIYARINNDFIGCFTTTSFKIGYQDLTPKFTVSGATSYCSNGSTTLTVVPVNNDFDPNLVAYAWTFNGNLIVDATKNSLLVSTNTGYGKYTVTVKNSICSATKEVIITENTDKFLITIESECEGKNYKLVASPLNESFDPNTVSYEWTGPTFVSDPDSPNTIILKSIGDYTVKVSTPEGCISEKSLNVSEINCLIQKGISPNGDGRNESFLLNDTKKLQIFNRYGTRVYSLSNYTNQWHGQTDDGDELPDGTYYYVIERNNEETVTGWIYINR